MAYEVAYDLDGVLAEAPPPMTKKYQHMNGEERKQYKHDKMQHYANAAILLTPSEDKFLVITARKHDPEIIAITKYWLQQNLPDKEIEICFFQSLVRKTYDSVGKFKVEKLKEHKVKQYTEDNKTILKIIHRLAPSIALYYYEHPNRTNFIS